MELLILLVGLVIFGFFASGWIAIALISAEGKSRKKALANKDEILAKVFSGEKVVTYSTVPFDSLKPDVVIPAAIERGYKLIHDDKGKLVFQKEED